VSGPGSRRLVVTSAAATDLASAYDWYEDQSPGLGAEFLRAVDAVFAAAQRTPTSFPVVRGRTRRALLRRFPYGFSSLPPMTKSSYSPSSTVAGIRASGNRVLKANVR
jgi:plasmid stabilization system protein ParE